MISFVWTPGTPLPAGTGGSENYTIGQVRELNRRGIHAQVVTVGLCTADGRDEFTDIPFRSLRVPAEVSDLDGVVIFVADFPEIDMSRPVYQMLHIPPPLRDHERGQVLAQTRDRGLIATSRFAARIWADYLDVDLATIGIAYPFAEPCFGDVLRPAGDPLAIRVLYAGRLTPEKGIYTLLAMLHSDLIVRDTRLSFTATTAGADKPQGQIIQRVVEAHPGIQLVPARKTPQAMAALMADHDIVVMPSNSQYWHETFGIVSLEAQHAGCRVVASDDGGLPETDCGAATLVMPDNAEALARGIRTAIAMGPPSEAIRRGAATCFTVAQSTDQLLAILRGPQPITPATIERELETLVNLPARTERPVLRPIGANHILTLTPGDTFAAKPGAAQAAHRSPAAEIGAR